MNAIRDLLSLTTAEKRLISAAAQDKEADLRGPGKGQPPVIRAQVLRDLCTGGNPQWKVKDRIRMTGGQVRGHVGLAGAELIHPLRFTDCVFEDRVDLGQARATVPLEWIGGRTAAVLADGFETGSGLIIQNVTVTGLISLHWANVRGDLRLTGSHLLPPSHCRALYGKDLRVGGSLFLDGADFRAEGEVCLQSARIGGQLNCRHASFSNPTGYSIDAGHLVLTGEILCEEGFHADGEVCLQWAKVGRLRATGGSFASGTHYALHADSLRAPGGVYLDRGFRATAAVRLVGANITGELCCTKGTFDNPSARALDAERIVTDDVYLDRGFVARGEVRFTDAQVKRQFNASNGDFRNEHGDRYALDADGLHCGGDVYLNDGFHATGEVRLIGAEIGSELNCTAGTFANADGRALFADGLTTPGMVYLDRGFRALGEVRLARATVGRQLVCTGGVFDNQHGTALDLTGLISPGDALLTDGFRATGLVRMRDTDLTRDLDFTGAQLHGGEGLDARGLHVGGCLTWIMDEPPEGPVDLSFGTLSRLNDTAESWPDGRYTLAGLAYRPTADGRMTVEQRITWLRQTSAYSADAYQQLVQAYRLGGDAGKADWVAIASQRDLRKRGKLAWRSRAWNRFLDFAVGYGYRLHRPFLALLVLGLIGWILYYWAAGAGFMYSTQGSDHVSAVAACPPGYPCFNSFIYSFQLLIPGLDLREATYWLPNASTATGKLLMAYTWLMIVLGWVAATAVVAGITRIFRQR